jgi:hypothetical protein
MQACNFTDNSGGSRMLSKFDSNMFYSDNKNAEFVVLDWNGSGYGTRLPVTPLENLELDIFLSGDDAWFLANREVSDLHTE